LLEVQHLKNIEKRSIFGAPVGIEEMQLVRESVVIGLPHDAEKRCDSDSTSQEHSRFGRFLCGVKDPMAGSIFTCVSRRTLRRCVARAGGEQQVVFKGRTGDRKGARVALSVSFWRIGERQVGRCPGLKSSRTGFSKWKAMVPSATSAIWIGNQLSGLR
jgi:hypothetical protein